MRTLKTDILNQHARRMTLVCLLLALRTADAGIVLNDPELWDSGTAGWENTAPIGTETADLDNPGTGGPDGGGDGYLSITFNQMGVAQDTIYTSGEAYTGNYQLYQPLGLSVTFDFYSPISSSGMTALYLHSAVSDDLWTYAFDAASGWNSYAISFDYDAGWSGWGTSADFWDDLANVAWIGINIEDPGGGNIYGLDNWQYAIPEPGQIFLSLAAMLSMLLAWRRSGSVCGACTSGAVLSS